LDKALEVYEVAITIAEQSTGDEMFKLKQALYQNYTRLFYDPGRPENAKVAWLKAFPPGK
jgi:hypothetical protein